MNVKDVISSSALASKRTPLGVEEMLSLRAETFTGFAEIETRNGGLIKAPPLSLSTRRGQEAARSLVMRVLEELLEAREATSRIHMLEELIDAWNYALALGIMDREVRRIVEDRLEIPPPSSWGTGILWENLFFDLLVEDLSPLLETFRCRIWQESAQSTYFDGVIPLVSFLNSLFRKIAGAFLDFQEFSLIYRAKDEVLKFRIRSRY